jgi:integrase/recombinase XerD
MIALGVDQHLLFILYYKNKMRTSVCRGEIVDVYINEFLAYLRVEKELASSTIRGYHSTLNKLNRYLVQQKDISNWNQVTYHHLRDYIHYIAVEIGIGPSSRARSISNFKSFFTYLYLEEVIDRPIADRLIKPKLVKKLPVYLTIEECRRFIDVIRKKSDHANRDCAIIQTFLYTGMRISELCQLNVSDVNLEQESIKVFGKGRKERLCPMAPQLKVIMSSYLDYRKEWLGVDYEKINALFVSHYNHRWSRINQEIIQSLIHHYANIANINKEHFSAHKLRHTFATLLYSAGVDLLKLKDLLGHTYLSTTQIYTHTSVEQLRSAIEKHPLDLHEDSSTYSLDSHPLDSFLSKYLTFLKVEKELAPRSIHEYYLNLQMLKLFLIKTYQIKRWDQVTYHHLRAFLHYLIEERKNSARARAVKVSCMKGFFKYLYLEEQIPRPIGDRLIKPKFDQKLPVYLTVEECHRFINLIREESRHSIRNSTIILVFLYTGIRITELCQLNVENLDFESATIKIMDKGRKERLIPMSKQLKSILQHYLVFRENYLGLDAEDISYLFVSRRYGKWNRLNRRTIHDLFNHYASKARINQQHFSAHKLRHTFATLLYSAGVELIELQQLLGHAKLDTTQIYTHTSTKDLKDAVAKHPLKID